MIRAQVNAGIARAKAQGKHCGRPPLAFELAERIREALAVPGRPGIRVIAKQFGVSPRVFEITLNPGQGTLNLSGGARLTARSDGFGPPDPPPSGALNGKTPQAAGFCFCG